MKNLATLFPFFVLLTFTNNLAAQKTKLGIKAGANVSNFTGTVPFSPASDIRIGFHAGLYTQIKLAFFTMQPELLLSTAGSKLTSGDVVKDLQITYLSIPIMLRIKLLGGLSAEAGPQFSYKIDESIGNSQVIERVKNTDLSLALGLSFKIAFIHLYGRYLAGISKIGEYSSGTQPNFRNGIFQAGISLSLLRKK